jgi:hypothetical protein
MGIVVLACGGALTTGVTGAGAAATPRTVTVRVEPALPGVHFTVNGLPGVTGAGGEATLVDPGYATASDNFILTQKNVLPLYQVTVDRVISDPQHGLFSRTLLVGLDVYQPISFQLLTPQRTPYPISRVSSIVLASSLGNTTVLTHKELQGAVVLPVSRPNHNSTGLTPRLVAYDVESVNIRGSNVVNSGQWRFSTNKEVLNWKIPILLYNLTVQGNDLLAGAPAGKSVQITFPNQSVETVALNAQHRVTVPNLPRGTYKVKVKGGLYPLASTVRLSKSQVATEIVITDGDGAELFAILLVVAAVLIGAGIIGRRLRRRATSRVPAEEPVSDGPPEPTESTVKAGEPDAPEDSEEAAAAAAAADNPDEPADPEEEQDVSEEPAEAEPVTAAGHDDPVEVEDAPEEPEAEPVTAARHDDPAEVEDAPEDPAEAGSVTAAEHDDPAEEQDAPEDPAEAGSVTADADPDASDEPTEVPSAGAAATPTVPTESKKGPAPKSSRRKKRAKTAVTASGLLAAVKSDHDPVADRPSAEDGPLDEPVEVPALEDHGDHPGDADEPVEVPGIEAVAGGESGSPSGQDPSPEKTTTSNGSNKTSSVRTPAGADADRAEDAGSPDIGADGATGAKLA